MTARFHSSFSNSIVSSLPYSIAERPTGVKLLIFFLPLLMPKVYTGFSPNIFLHNNIYLNIEMMS